MLVSIAGLMVIDLGNVVCGWSGQFVLLQYVCYIDNIFL